MPVKWDVEYRKSCEGKSRTEQLGGFSRVLKGRSYLQPFGSKTPTQRSYQAIQKRVRIEEKTDSIEYLKKKLGCTMVDAQSVVSSERCVLVSKERSSESTREMHRIRQLRNRVIKEEHQRIFSFLKCLNNRTNAPRKYANFSKEVESNKVAFLHELQREIKVARISSAKGREERRLSDIKKLIENPDHLHQHLLRNERYSITSDDAFDIALKNNHT